MDTAEEFESAVRESLVSFRGTDGLRFGAAVSGGADSMSLLVSLSRILKKGSLFAVTVNHNIREKSETEGDADFVQSFCEKISVPCCRCDIERGAVEKLAAEKKCGIEEAARRLRYREFDSFIERNGIDVLCLAHNSDDDTETMLMNFLRGSSLKSMEGIPLRRGKYFRPLLSVSRKDIEKYLSVLGVGYRTDSTNSDEAILRNLIRRRLIPFLDQNMSWWRGGIKKSKAKIHDASLIIEKNLESIKDSCRYKVIQDQESTLVSFSSGEFSALEQGERVSLLLSALDDVKASDRVTRSFLEEASCGLSLRDCTFSSCGVQFVRKNRTVTVQKELQVATEKGFFVIMEEEGMYASGPWKISARCSDSAVILECNGRTAAVRNLKFPFAVKSITAGDYMRSRGKVKPVSSILEQWKCGERKKLVPLVISLVPDGPYEKMETVCIFGSVLGFPDRISLPD